MALSLDIDVKQLDRHPFALHHDLANHPSLSLESLTRLVAEMPPRNVMFSNGPSNLTDHFESILIHGRQGQLQLNEVVEYLRSDGAYIAVSMPNLHPSFAGVFKALVEDVSRYLQANGTGIAPLMPQMWLFIASPGAVTPFHFDRLSNILMQIRGSKELAVFPPRMETVISAAETEAYLDSKPSYPKWSAEKDKHAIKFDLKPGDAVHIPYVSGHYVKNGTDDISITVSLFYHSRETQKWARAMRFNSALRQLRWRPRPVGSSPAVDGAKAFFHPVLDAALSVGKQLRRWTRAEPLSLRHRPTDNA